MGSPSSNYFNGWSRWVITLLGVILTSLLSYTLYTASTHVTRDEMQVHNEDVCDRLDRMELRYNRRVDRLETKIDRLIERE